MQDSAYDPALLDIGIVHLGVGAFHRAHMADYTDEVLRKGDLRWGIMGASLRSPDTRDALAPQDFLYTIAESDEAGERCRVIGALRGVLVAPEDPQALIERHVPALGEDRLAHRHREGLLPRSGDGRTERAAPRHHPRPRQP